MSLRVFSALLLTLILQACDADSSVNNIRADAKNGHFIQPNEVANYVATFQSQYEQIKLILDGKEFPVEFYDMSPEQKFIVVKFAEGLLTFGFDFDNAAPIPAMFSIERANDVLNRKEITATAEGDNIKLHGTLEDAVSGGLYNVEFIINESLLGAGNADFKLDNAKRTATVNGTLGTSSYVKLKALIHNNPDLNTLILENVEGSVNDEINLHTGRLVRAAQLTTEVGAKSAIYSGGVDLYASGYRRRYQEGAIIGVHSWCCGANGKDAASLGENHPDHGPYLTFSREMLGDELGPDFYFFTIKSAPASGIHKMTKAEVKQYLLAEQPR